jgi:hypothetical protein
VSLVYREALRNGKVKSNPVRLVRQRKESDGLIRFLRDDEERTLRRVIDKHYPESVPPPVASAWRFPASTPSVAAPDPPATRPMAMRLLSDSLLNLADNVLYFSGILFSSAVSLQVGVAGKFAGLLPDCAFDFVKLARCLIFCARFHHDSLLCSVVVVDSLRCIEGYSHRDCPRLGKALFGKASLPDRALYRPLSINGLADGWS